MEPQPNVLALSIWAIASLPIGALSGYLYERFDSTTSKISHCVAPIMLVNPFASIPVSATVVYYVLIKHPLIAIIAGIIYGVVVFSVSIFCADYGYRKWIEAIR